MNSKLSKCLSGIAGEYYVAAELSKLGYMASITLRNNDSIDIHASKESGNKIFAIQVKTNQSGGRSWPLTRKSEDLQSNNLFYVFVSLKGVFERPEYFIVPSCHIAKELKAGHQVWLETPGKKGQKHNDTNMRQFQDKAGVFLEKWDLLN